MASGHQKHAKIAKPLLGEFGRQEWAIIGTPCDEIQKLAQAIIAALANRLKIAYVDADHKSKDETVFGGMMRDGAYVEYTDKNNFHQINWPSSMDKYRFRALFNEVDITLVNGHHFLANQQIVVLDPKKELSLAKSLDRLTNVNCFITVDEGPDSYEFLETHLGREKMASIPSFHRAQVDQIATWMFDAWKRSTSNLNGLVLAGGKSLRMGEDKGGIVYHDKPQREVVATLLNKVCQKTFLSYRKVPIDQSSMADTHSILEDKIEGLGPFGALLTAFLHDPNAAWLVVACDLPLVDQIFLQELIEQRDPSKVATAFQSPHNQFPEPLITIWEPKSYALLLQFMAQGFTCPRKVLLNTDIALINPSTPKKLMNVNFPEERDEVLALLGKLGK